MEEPKSPGAQAPRSEDQMPCARSCQLCPAHDAMLGRMKAIEDVTTKAVSDLRGAVMDMVSDVSELHQTVVRTIADKTAVMPTSVRVMIAIPSVLVSICSVIWLAEQIHAFMK
jgi:hypothetical protein